MGLQMILALLSGGIDSVAMTYLLLKQGERLHIHHVEIENQENRTLAENIAVNKTLDYFRSVGLDNFEYTTNKVSSPTINGKFLYDSDTTNFIAGFICDANPKITQVAMGINKEDMRVIPSPRIKRGNDLLQLFAKVEKLYPIKDYSKKDLYELLPQELKDIVWSCRTPKYEGVYAKPCYQCYTCGQMKFLGLTQKDLLLS